MTLTNLGKAVWLESAYSAGRCYDMSTDSIRPRADFVPREYFWRVYDAGFNHTASGEIDLECRGWIWQFVTSRNLTMDDVKVIACE